MCVLGDGYCWRTSGALAEAASLLVMQGLGRYGLVCKGIPQAHRVEWGGDGCPDPRHVMRGNSRVESGGPHQVPRLEERAMRTGQGDLAGAG